MSVYPKRLIEVDLPIARIGACAAGEVDSAWAYLDAAYLVGAAAAGGVPGGDCAALWPDPADPLCPLAFREKSIEAIKAFADRVCPPKINEEGAALREMASPESLGRWEAIAAGTLTLTADQPGDMQILRLALLDFIADFANWDNSTIAAYRDTSRALTQAAHEALGGSPRTRPLVVDPFAGGGSIPLEALRVGADAFASDLNPVAVLLNKVILEYIPKYGQRLAEEVRKWGEWIKCKAEKELAEFYPKDADGATPIAYLWARTINCEGPGCGAEVPLIRSLWLAKKDKRSVAIQLVTNAKAKRVDFCLIVKKEDRWVRQDDDTTEVSNPKLDGTVKRGSASCPCCGYTTPVASVRRQLKMKRGCAEDARLLCVVSTRTNEAGRFYRTPTERDHEALQRCLHVYRDLIAQRLDGGMTVVPTESTEEYHSFVNRGPIYGMKSWDCYFSPRQTVALAAISQLIRQVAALFRESESEQFGDALQTCLSLNFGRLLDLANSLCGWTTDTQCVKNLFRRQALPMVWNFAECVPIGQSAGSWSVVTERFPDVLASLSVSNENGQAQLADATKHPLPSDSVDAVITDPPYYYSVQYADLADFFYVWLRRTLHGVQTDLLKHPVIQKDREIIVQSPGHEFAAEGKNNRFYERLMGEAMSESRRELKPSGIALVVFAHTSTSGWESQLQAMIDAGWIITGSWPIDTEMATRVMAQGRSVLASSVHLVCRPRKNPDGSVRMDEVGDWRDVLQELPNRIHEWMPRLAAEGVVGADAIFSCLGPALEVFSRYGRVEKSNGEPATLREYLEHVWAAVSTEVLSLIFKDADAAGLEPDARLTAMWLWTIGGGETNGNGKSSSPRPSPAPSTSSGQTKGEGEETDSPSADEDDEESSGSGRKGKATGGFTLEFDAARKIAQGLGIHLEKSESIVEVKADKARLLPVGERTRHLFGKDSGNGAPPTGRGKKKAPQKNLFEELGDAEAAEAGWTDLKGPPPGSTVLDCLHQTMILFAAGRSELMKRFLVEEGVGSDARFWKLAQSLSALYPPGTDEKRWVDGVLARKKGLGL